MELNSEPTDTPEAGTDEDELRLVEAMASFGIELRVLARHVGPRTITYRVMPGPGVTVAAITRRALDVGVQLSTASCTAREEQGRLFVEIAREDMDIPRLGALPPPANPKDILVGVDSLGAPVHVRLDNLPHCIVAGSSGCLHGDTPIHDPVDGTTKTVRERWALGVGFHVWALGFDGQPVVTAAMPPEQYRAHQMLRITLTNGEVVTVTPAHRFWTERGWMTAAAVSELHAGSERVLLPSTAGNGPSARAEDAYAATSVAVKEVQPIDPEPYYDFHVPVFENYWAQSIWHHNSGKSTALRVILRGVKRDSSRRLIICDPKGSGDFEEFRRGRDQVHADLRSACSALWMAGEILMLRTGQKRVSEVSAAARSFGDGDVLLVVDEVQMITSKGAKEMLNRVLAAGRSMGMNCILATQQPSAQVLGNEMRANCPTRLVFRVASQSDSRVALGDSGAERLLGLGDGLLRYLGQVTRIQVPSIG